MIWQETSELGVQVLILVQAPSSTPVLLHSTAAASPPHVIPLKVLVQECALTKLALTRQVTSAPGVQDAIESQLPSKAALVAHSTAAAPPDHVVPSKVEVHE